MSLKEKLKKLMEEQEQGISMLEATKAKWITEANRLLSEIDNWIEEYVSEGLANIQRNNILIKEDRVTEYELPSFYITFLNKGSIQIQPIGTFLIGASGRIDITIQPNKGLPKTLLLIRTGRDEEPSNWKIIEQGSRNRSGIDFSIENIELKIEESLE
jgi:hypothetical protein